MSATSPDNKDSIATNPNAGRQPPSIEHQDTSTHGTRKKKIWPWVAGALGLGTLALLAVTGDKEETPAPVKNAPDAQPQTAGPAYLHNINEYYGVSDQTENIAFDHGIIYAPPAVAKSFDAAVVYNTDDNTAVPMDKISELAARMGIKGFGNIYGEIPIEGEYDNSGYRLLNIRGALHYHTDLFNSEPDTEQERLSREHANKVIRDNPDSRVLVCTYAPMRHEFGKATYVSLHWYKSLPPGTAPTAPDELTPTEEANPFAKIGPAIESCPAARP